MGESPNEATADTIQNSTKTDNPQSKENIFENRQRHKKLVRVVTVMAYLFSVSFVAIALSGYYVCFWQPPDRRSTPKARAMSQAQAQSSPEISATQSPITNDNSNIKNNTDFDDKTVNYKNKISLHDGMNISSNESLQSNQRILNSTSAFVNPITTQMFQNKADKVTTDRRIDIYGILNSHTDLPGETANLETSTLFMETSSEKESVTTDFPFSTNLLIENEQIDPFNSSSSVENEHIDGDRIFNDNETLLSGQQESDDINQSMTVASTINLDEILPTASMQSSPKEYHEEKMTKIVSQDDAEISSKLRDILPPLPIHLKERQRHADQTKEEAFSVLSTIAPPSINVENLETNNSKGKKLNQYNLPKR